MNELEFDLRRFHEGELELFSGIARRATKVGDMGQMAQPVPATTIGAAIAPTTTGRIPPPTPRSTAFKSKQTPVKSAPLPPATPVSIAASRLLEAASGTISLASVGLMSPRLKPRAAATMTATMLRTVSETMTTTTMMTASDDTTTTTLLSPSLAVISGGGDKGVRPTRRRGGVKVGAAAATLIFLEDPIASSDPIAAGWAEVSAPKVETGGENVVPLEKAVIKGGGRGSRVSSRAASASKS